jgi:phosphatidylglycerophosphatase A
MQLKQPSWTGRLPTAWVVGAATLGPIGRRLPAPGTWGSAVGVAYFWIGCAQIGGASEVVSVGWNLSVSVIAAYVAVALCGEAEIRLGKSDPGEVILDEVVAMPLCFLGWPTLLAAMPPWVALLAGFALFRLFDIAKPLGISRLQRLPGGWGVVIDDLAAALAACTTLHLGAWAWMTFGR